MIAPQTDPTLYQNTWLDKVFNDTGKKLKSYRQVLAKRRLEAKLERFILLSLGYKKQNIPPDNPLWGMLRDSTAACVDQYCTEWGISRDDLVRENPGIRELLEPLSTTPSFPQLASWLRIAGLGLLGLWVLGALAGIVASGYHFVISHLWG